MMQQRVGATEQELQLLSCQLEAAGRQLAELTSDSDLARQQLQAMAADMEAAAKDNQVCC